MLEVSRLICREGLIPVVTVEGILDMVEVLQIAKALGIKAALSLPIALGSMQRLPQRKAKVVTIQNDFVAIDSRFLLFLRLFASLLVFGSVSYHLISVTSRTEEKATVAVSGTSLTPLSFRNACSLVVYEISLVGVKLCVILCTE